MSADGARKHVGVDVLFLRLEGVWQSWGENSRWTVRDTRREPTKSGVIGLLAAAAGMGRGDDRVREWGISTRIGVREDRPGRLERDYHTVAGGADRDPAYANAGVLSAEGKIKVTQSSGKAETVVSERSYLADACFLVAIEGPGDVLDAMESAIRSPVWAPFLGRKSCPPSLPLYPVLADRPSRDRFASLTDALRRFPFIGDTRLAERQGRSHHEMQAKQLRCVLEGEGVAEGIATTRQDVPLDFAGRHFGFRSVTEFHLALDVTQQE